MRLLVYSHDSFGLGNIRRMMAICQHLLHTIGDLTILLVSGSPMVHSFRLPQGLDYIKLPCLGRDRTGKLGAKFLGTSVEDTLSLRSNLIKTVVADFQPDLIMVDKKPFGLLGELEATLDYLKTCRPYTQIILLLRDILDDAKNTIEDWQKHNYYQAIEQYYDRILVVGMSEIYNVVEEYLFPPTIATKTSFCGYIKKSQTTPSAVNIRQQLQLQSDEKLILVTPGGGGDGYNLVKHFLDNVESLAQKISFKSVIICGPEMSAEARDRLAKIAQIYPQVVWLEFTDDLIGYIRAADLVIAMGGYNTVTEILSCQKKAIIIPRINPVQEQLIRAQRLKNLGLLQYIHPQYLNSNILQQLIIEQLNQSCRSEPTISLDFNGLSRIETEIKQIVWQYLAQYRRSQYMDFAKSFCCNNQASTNTIAEAIAN